MLPVFIFSVSQYLFLCITSIPILPVQIFLILLFLISLFAVLLFPVLWVRVNQRDHFPLNVGRFPLPACWLYAKCIIGGGKRKAESGTLRETVTLIYQDPSFMFVKFFPVQIQYYHYHYQYYQYYYC